ncbi:MAG: FtsW/RodA/SpoVE family cell cycle protein [Phycisphaerales bacterium]|nr:FtsW/RodA/SpoVE family cell cycle protein [Phycisphaerales bacterium]
MSGVAIKRGSTQGRLPGAGRAMHASRVVMINPALMSCAAALFLSLLGVVVIGTTEPGYAARHAMLLSVSLVTACIVAWVHPRTWCQLAIPGMVFTLGLLVFVLVPWIPDALVHPRHGARRWINLGLIDMQPSELAKVSYIVVLAAYFRYRKNHRSLRGLVIPLGLTLIPIGLILVEPDLGTSLLFLPTLFAMLIAAGARFKHLLILILLGLVAAGCMAPLLKPHQRARIAAMVAHVQGDTQFDHDIGFQGARARTLIGAGGLTGLGREQASVLIEYNHLPEEHNDMVFAVIGCRWGLLGAGVTWLAFLVLAVGGIIAAARTKEAFSRLLAVGIVAMLVSQMLINTGMTIGLMPITGLTLPFVSYGGSSLIIAWIMMGLLMGISMRRSPILAKSPFEFDDGEDE